MEFLVLQQGLIKSPSAPCYVTGEQSYSIPEVATVTSLTLALTHGSNTDAAGSLYSVGSGHIGKLRWERSKGVFLNPDLNFSAGVLATRWSEMQDFSERQYPTSAMDFGKLLPKMQQLPANTKHPSPEFTGKVVLVTGGASG
jgi:hypothetical protein